MARVALQQGMFHSVGALARSLRLELWSAGITYDVRTLKRQMLGSIATVPPDVQSAMSKLLSNGKGRRPGASIRELLRTHEAGCSVASSEPPYLLAVKVLPLAQLWLHLNPGSSKRAMASRLQSDMEREGVSCTVASLQTILAGKNRLLVRTLIRDGLLAYVAELGFRAGDEAIGSLPEELARSLAMRELIPVRRFRELCLLWLWERRGASSRRLSMLLHEKLLLQGVRMSGDHLQRAVAGVPRRVRRLVQTVLEELSRTQSRRPRDLDVALDRTAIGRETFKRDMSWVRADPIVALAKTWPGHHPGSSMRQLALCLAGAIERMGYSMSHNSIQPILGGWKKKRDDFCTGRW